MNDLFSGASTGAVPLAERLRPRSIGDVVGQRHLLAPGKPLAVAFAAGKPHSMLLSRAAVYVLEPLSDDDLSVLLERALAAAIPSASVEAAARDALIGYADGDGRRLINMVEQLGVAAGEASRTSIDLAFVEATIA